MASVAQTISDINAAASWNARVTKIRQVPQHHGVAEHAAVYAEVAHQLYVPNFQPDYAFIHWRDDYELEDFAASYEAAYQGTAGFTDVDLDSLTRLLQKSPRALRTFRTITGLTTQEFAEATAAVGELGDLDRLSNGRVKSIEQGGVIRLHEAQVAARTIDELLNQTLFSPGSPDYRLKQAKPDTTQGWESVRGFAEHGVPFAVFLHQRHYGGAFRQLLDATSTRRGNLIEDVVQDLLANAGVPFVRTGSHNQAEIESRFGVTVRPAPDFVVFDAGDNLRAMLECKGANDGGTARDKASRFRGLRTEAGRLGGVPLVAVLSGLGWTRVNDTLGPVVRDCDGRVFTLANLPEMLTVTPFPELAGIAP